MEEVLDSPIEESNSDRIYKTADNSKRIGNYIIDIIGFLVFAAFIGIVWGLLAVSTNNEQWLDESESMGGQLIDTLFSYLVMIIYYVLSEYFLSGKTLGKYLTKTRAVTIDNQRMEIGTVIIRSLCRLIPFEAFSFLIGSNPRGWHDKFSNTKVIEDNGWRE